MPIREIMREEKTAVIHRKYCTKDKICPKCGMKMCKGCQVDHMCLYCAEVWDFRDHEDPLTYVMAKKLKEKQP